MKGLEAAASWVQEHEKYVLVSHADADGIAATAIVEVLLETLAKEYKTIFIPQISSLTIRLLGERINEPVIFIDTGSSHVQDIEDAFSPGTVLVLDHHQIDCAPATLMLNPFLSGLDGTRDVSSSGIAYLLASHLSDAAQLSPIALIGAQADHQEPFQGINKDILEIAEREGLVKRRRGARLFGTHSRTLVSLIAKSYDLKISSLRNPGNARKLLDDLGIEAETFAELSIEEATRLEQHLISSSPHPQPEITHYTLAKMPAGPLRDTREAATLLNACGRLGKPEVAVAMLKGDPDSRVRALEIQEEYRRAVSKAHEWYAKRKGSSSICRENDLLIINAQDNIPPDIAGTLCSVLSRGREVPPRTTVVCLARNGDGTTKVSSRALKGDRDLARLMKRSAERVGGEGGGHSVAAGAVIPSGKESAFIQELLDA